MVEPRRKIEGSPLTDSEKLVAHNLAVTQALAQENDLKKLIQAVSSIDFKEIIDIKNELQQDAGIVKKMQLKLLQEHTNQNKKDFAEIKTKIQSLEENKASLTQISSSVDSLASDVGKLQTDHSSLTGRHNKYIEKEAQRRNKAEMQSKLEKEQQDSKYNELIAKISGLDDSLKSEIKNLDNKMEGYFRVFKQEYEVFFDRQITALEQSIIGSKAVEKTTKEEQKGK